MNLKKCPHCNGTGYLIIPANKSSSGFEQQFNCFCGDKREDAGTYKALMRANKKLKRKLMKFSIDEKEIKL